MIIDIITIFPNMFEGIIGDSIIKRSIDKNLVTINVHDFRDYSKNIHKKVDDTTYGGGAGMLIGMQAITDCLKSIEGYTNAHKILTSPSGKVYNQAKAKELSKNEHLIIICGHYEGIDDRILNYVDEEISIGDYILTGGEIASLAILDSVVRLIDGAINKESIGDESFENGLLEYYQFTKPADFDGYQVPEILINGNHEEIRKYRLYTSLKRTYENRYDLLEKKVLNEEEELYLSYIKLGMSYDEAQIDIKNKKKAKKHKEK